MEMNEERARKILKPEISLDGKVWRFRGLGNFARWQMDKDNGTFCEINACLNVESIDALAWWMRNKGKE